MQISLRGSNSVWIRSKTCNTYYYYNLETRESLFEPNGASPSTGWTEVIDENSKTMVYRNVYTNEVKYEVAPQSGFCNAQSSRNVVSFI